MSFRFIKDTLHYKRKIGDWQAKYDASAPKVGDLAPDFELQDITGEQSIKLSEFRGKKPVALIFGSFT